MKTTIELTDRALSVILEALRVSTKDLESVLRGEKIDDYAGRILRTRQALDLSNADSDCCYDYIQKF